MGNRRFLFYSMFNLVVLILILVDLIVIQNNNLISLFPIISIILFMSLIIKFIRISFGCIKINLNKEWFYNFYNREVFIFIIIIFFKRCTRK